MAKLREAQVGGGVDSMDQAPTLAIIIIIIIIVVIGLALSHHVKHGPVRVHTGHRLDSVHVAHDALRHRDPLEHGVWHSCWAMATHGEYAFLTIRVKNPQDNQATARVFRAADLVDTARR